MLVLRPPYSKIDTPNDLPQTFIIGDHLGGFDENLNNFLFATLNDYASTNNKSFQLLLDQPFDSVIHDQYPNLELTLDIKIFQQYHPMGQFGFYNIHPTLQFDNFLCTFNGSPHVSRKLLVSILNKFGWFSPDFCSKNFTYRVDELDGHIFDFIPHLHQYYRKFFLSQGPQDFAQTIYSFGHVQYHHNKNIHNLEDKITKSFLHLVSETMATSYYPYVTEKFLYSVVTRGLFLAYAQPDWHDYLEKYYGFKKYDKIFDYQFDKIKNPIIRLVDLISMISKFSILSSDEWNDLYEMEIDTIEYNYDHYFSKNYIKHLEKFC